MIFTNRASTIKTLAALVLAVGGFAFGASAQVSFTASNFVSSTAPTETGRLFRDGVPSVYTTQKAFPGTSGSPSLYHYDTYTIISPFNVPYEFDIDLSYTATTNFPFSVAYLGTFDPTNLATHYLGDAGVSPVGTGTVATDTPYSVTVPAGGVLTLIVNETTLNAGTSFYTLTARAVQAVPEPSTWAILAVGAVGGFALLRRARPASETA